MLGVRGQDVEYEPTAAPWKNVQSWSSRAASRRRRE